MKLVSPKVEYLPQAEGLEGIYEQIEVAGRTCYKSSSKYRYWTANKKGFINEGTEDFKILYSPEKYPFKQNVSAHDFVERMIASKHNAMLEHGTVYLKMPEGFHDENLEHDYSDYMYNKYSRVQLTYEEDNGGTSYANISTNFRVLVENNWLNDLQFICAPTRHHEKRYSFDIITSIGITRELIRHRVFSFANESTRFCNYSKDKFNNEITVIKPYWYEEIEDPGEIDPLFAVCSYANKIYDKLISEGFTPQQAREVLPLCTKSEIIMTGFKSDWEDFLDKRLRGTTGAPHPDMKLIAAEIEKQLNLKE